MDTSDSSTEVQTDFIPYFYPAGKLPTTGRNRVIATIYNETPDRLPRSFTAAPAVQKEQWEVLERLYQRYPSDILVIDGRNPEQGYCNQVSEPIDLSDDNFAQTLELFCDITSQFTLGIVPLSPWLMLQSLLEDDSTEDYDDLLVRFEKTLQPWLDSPLDGLCLYDPLSSYEKGWDREAVRNFTDLTPFYRRFVRMAKNADKFVFMDFGGKVLQAIPLLLKMEVDVISCVLDTELAMELSDFTASFTPHSEDPNGRRLTFWASLPNSLEKQADWFADKKAAQSILTELNQLNKGVIARGVWQENQSWKCAALALQAWEQGIPIPKTVSTDQKSTSGSGNNASNSSPDSSKNDSSAVQSPDSQQTGAQQTEDSSADSQSNTENVQ
ncbi:MAG: hypothetical protein IKX40_06125 [Thermoguttaceae bacterium]|nr:hypothetical protein [Thermoguttaceae bacterium]